MRCYFIYICPKYIFTLLEYLNKIFSRIHNITDQKNNIASVHMKKEK